MSLKPIYWWYKIPFARILFDLVTGIIMQWQFMLPLQWCAAVMIIGFLSTGFYSFLSINLKFRYRFIAGSLIHLMIIAAGAILVCQNQLPDQIRKPSSIEEFQVAIIKEPLTEKPNSFKTIAAIKTFKRNQSLLQHEAQVIIYFKKDSAIQLQYGSVIIFKKQIQEIKNSGNPGGFDYKQYCHFNGITGQVYLNTADFLYLNDTGRNWFYSFILDSRSWVVSCLRKFIHGKKEQGLAEALLIGYKDDLDKNLVQAYANTGVVHVIAISGLHLGLIYWLLLLITKPLQKKKALIWVRLIIILCSLWIFSILAGAQPSVLRSAVMFSFIAWGSVVQRRASIFNTISLSAFVLLCYNPFWLWDAGFQLSYAAVLSIIVFFKSIYNWFSFENRLLDLVWKLMAVTIAAQLLTLPISIYHFHQLPTLFLFTNIVAVPLSSLILFGEISLCVFSFSPTIAVAIGDLLEWMIIQMNHYIENMNRISFAVWDDLSINFLQAATLMIFICCLSSWLMEPRKYLLWISAMALSVMTTIRSISLLEAIRQRKLIIYNIPGQSAIDLMDGRQCYFRGDKILMKDDFLRNFHIRPCRTRHRIATIHELGVKEFRLKAKQVLIIDSVINLRSNQAKPSIDLVIISKSPKIKMTALYRAFTIKQIVIDCSAPSWKARQWKKECDSLRLPCYMVSEKGAFIMNW